MRNRRGTTFSSLTWRWVDGSIITVSSSETHTGKLATGKLAGFMERILVRAREDEPAQPRWKVGWPLGMVGADVQILEADGKRTRYEDWRHSPDADNDVSRKEMKEALQKIKEPSYKTQGCNACEHGAAQQSKVNTVPLVGRSFRRVVWHRASGK